MAQNYDVITFKADASLAKLLQGVSNRSAFIRSAILLAFDNLCPVCKGTGVLTPHKREHLGDVASKIEEDCVQCEEEGSSFKRNTK